METVKISVDRSKIDEAIKTYSPTAKIKGPEAKPNDLYIYQISIDDEPEATLNIYYIKGGKTTLTYKTGKNYSLGEKVVSHIIEKCQIKNTTDKSLYIKRLSTEHFTDIVEFLNDHNVTVNFDKNINAGKQYKATSEQGDYVYLNKYDAGSFQVQGAGKFVKSVVIEGLTNLLPYKEVIAAQLAEFDLNINSEEVVDQLENLLPDAFSFIGDTVKAIISPAIAFKSVNLTLSDYSSCAFPAFRGLEGYIKKLFGLKGIIIGKDGFGKYFTGTDPKTLNSITKTALGNSKLVRAIEESYNLLIKQRHSLFHVNGVIETTRILETKQESDELVEDVFETIQTS